MYFLHNVELVINTKKKPSFHKFFNYNKLFSKVFTLRCYQIIGSHKETWNISSWNLKLFVDYIV
jgi:hypothetical protein